jgi:hypothetical protein
LETNLPLRGIAWGDISTPVERLAGFGEKVGALKEGVTYPGFTSQEHDLNSEYFRGDSDREPLFRRY